MEKQLSFENEGLKFQGILATPDDMPKQGRSPLVLLCPGLTRGPDWHHNFPILAYALAKGGLASFRFDYRGRGNSQGKQEDATITSMISDVQCALRFLRDESTDQIDPDKVGIVGIGHGGYFACCVASEDSSIGAIASWGILARPSEGYQAHHGVDYLEKAKKDGFILINDVRCGLPLFEECEGVPYLADRLDRLPPALFLQARDDPVSKLETAQELVKALEDKGIAASLEVLPGRRHFDPKEPSGYRHIDRTVSWFKSHFASSA